MHTDHSSDCATPVETLLATARERGLGAIAITDHNEVSGALAARELADEFGVKVIVAEEVKTAEQGEVIGLFLERKIERGMTMAETIAEIRRQGGLVYVPHPFDRLHSVPDYEHLLDIVDEIDILEVFNPRVALTAFNEEAERFAAKYRIVPGAGSDSHVAQGLGSVMIRVHDFNGPEEFLEAMRSADIVRKQKNLVYVQTLKWLQTGGGRGGKRVATPQPRALAARQGADARPSARQEAAPGRQRSPSAPRTGRTIRPMPATDDEIQEKYLERAIRELNQLTHRLQECSHCPRGSLMPVLGSGPSAGRRDAAQVRADGGGDRGGRRVLRPQRQRADEELQAARDRPARRLRDALREVPDRRSFACRRGMRRARDRGDRDRPAALRRRHGGARARDAQRPRPAAVPRARGRARPRSRA